MIADLALNHLTAQERKQIRVFTFGGWGFIEPGKAHPESHNFLSPYDIIPKAGTPGLSILLIRLQDGAKRGLSAEDVIEEMIQEDIDYYLDTKNISTIEKFRKSRKKHYEKLMERIVNVTILQENVEGPFEHCFDSKCYQIALKKVLKKYKKQS